MSDELRKVIKDNSELEKLERSLKNGGNLKPQDVPKAPNSSSTKEVKKSS